MNCPLVVAAPSLGARSETFIRRHMRGLLPGRTAVIVSYNHRPAFGYWDVAGPKLVRSEHENPTGLLRRAVRAGRRRIGLPPREFDGVVERFIVSAGAEVILAEYLDHSLRYIDMAERLGIPLYAHAHGYDVSERLESPEWVQRYFQLDRCAGVITMSHFSKQRLVALGLTSEKIHVVPYGVDIPELRERKDRQDTIRCVAIGRMTSKKAPVVLLDAFRRAAEADARLVLDYIGGGELFSAAWQFVQAFGLNERVTLHGSLDNDEALRFLRRADLFIQHSITCPESGDQEGLPVAILEAMANGLPVVSTRHAGIPEAVIDGTTGYLVSELDSSVMADRILALAESSDLRCQFGRAARDRARERFAWQEERSSLLELLGLADRSVGSVEPTDQAIVPQRTWPDGIA